MKIKITSGTPKVGVTGLGMVKTNEWVTVTKEQEEAFERHHGRTVAESFEVQKETKTKKKEAS